MTDTIRKALDAFEAACKCWHAGAEAEANAAVSHARDELERVIAQPQDDPPCGHMLRGMRKSYCERCQRAAAGALPRHIALSDEQIVKIAFDLKLTGIPSTFVRFARAVIEAHVSGVTPSDTTQAVMDLRYVDSVLQNVLGDIEGWEDKELAEAVAEARERLKRVAQPLVLGLTAGVEGKTK